jgi:transcriptional regulator with XRE-family HTH domain
MNAKQEQSPRSHIKQQGKLRTPFPSEYLGGQIRAARQQQELTLKALSAKSGIAASTLSKIENNQLSPSYQLLQQLLIALELDIPQLFENRQQEGGPRLSRRVITRSDHAVIHHTPTYEHQLLASEMTNKKMVPVVTRIRARSVDQFERLLTHTGEEFLLVLSGVVELHCEFYEPVSLHKGDSSYFDSTMKHALISTSERDAKVLWITASR